MIFKDSTILVKSNDYRVLGEDPSNNNYEFVPLRSLIPFYSKDEINKILKEYQHYIWNRRTKFCGACGGINNYDSVEGCKVCPSCGEKSYPFLFPAVIVSVVKNDTILLAHNKNFQGEMFSVIAGFVDIGESLEEAVQREVFEEVGLKIKNIEYFSSQNWGFTSSLMIGFKAEYESGDICVDGVEIDKAFWFTKDNLPEIPPTLSIARSLIDEFIN